MLQMLSTLRAIIKKTYFFQILSGNPNNVIGDMCRHVAIPVNLSVMHPNIY